MFESLIAKIARMLDEAGVRYMIIGGQAVLFYGEPRLTRDIDITLDATLEQLDDFSVALGESLLERFEEVWRESQ